MVTAFETMGFPFDYEPTANSQDDLAGATSGSHNLRRRSNEWMQSRYVGVGLALPGVPHVNAEPGGCKPSP